MKDRKAYEHKVVSQMIGIYCHDKHDTAKGQLCSECAALDAYANSRVDKCRYGNDKTFCANCPTHCYRPDMRENIRQVMRYAGPRMLFCHPVAAVKHLALSKKEQRKIAGAVKGTAEGAAKGSGEDCGK